MHNALNGLVFDSIAETANETGDAAGLDALSNLLDKLEGRFGFVTQPERLASARAAIAAKRKGLGETPRA